MNEIVLNATIREKLGRSAANTSRRSGTVPGVFYLHNDANIAIEVKALDLRPLVYTSDTHIVDLRLSDGSSRKCVLREVQFDPVTDRVIHFDLQGLVMTEKIRVEVPVVLEGAAPGVRAGGFLNHLLHKIEIECLPADLPEHITVDISRLQMGQTITIADLNLGSVTVNSEPDAAVVMLTHARGAAEETAAEGAAEIKEPEIISRGKGEDEG